MSLKFLRELPRAHHAVFLVALVAALLFAGFTNHVWEDYYITYRASKNLATGHGLVFNVGDRLHTFTSPLGVLLPALSSALTLNSSDTAALWIFRVLSAAAFAAAAALLYTSLAQLHRNPLVAGLAALWLIFDAKSLDFTINGMETGFLLLFVAWTFWAQFGDCSRRWLWLGLGWAGLMWTRPDGFLYIGLLAAGAFLFNDSARSGLTRPALLKLFLVAGLVCTAIYLPWFLGSWAYYGTPIPHTITAKSGVVGARTLGGALRTLVTLPVKIWAPDSSASAAFLPAYAMIGGWPAFLAVSAKALGFLAAFAWLLPAFRSPTRTASFAFFGLHAYLSYFPNFIYPWYLPGTTLLAYFTFAGIAATLTPTPFLRLLAVAGSILLAALNLWTCPAVARQVAAQQQIIENGTRRKIGEWLHATAAPGDRVFLESLGYIGYFSNLKTFDFPGMSSREMTDAIKQFGPEWAPLIDYLSPDWLVLRPGEIDRINLVRPDLLAQNYARARAFDVRADVDRLAIHGRNLLSFDSHFTVFHRRWPRRFPTELIDIASPAPSLSVLLDDIPMRLVHAPGTATFKIPPGATRFHVAFAFSPGAYDSADKTDGAAFDVVWVSGASEIVLLHRYLDPAANPVDRGVQQFNADLPPGSQSARLVLRTDPGANGARDWTCWSMPDFL